MVKFADKRRSRIRETIGDNIFKIGIYTFVTLCALAMLYPLVNVVAISLANYREYLEKPWMILPSEFNFDGYKYVFRNKMFWKSYGNTLLITSVGTILGLALTILMAYPLSRRELKGKPFFMAIVIFTMVFNAGTIPSYLNMQELGLLNTYWAMIFPYAFSAFNCVLMINAFKGIPYELTEAAQLDGANDLYILTRIVLPLSKPVIATVALFLIVGYWNNYFAAQLYCTLERDIWPVAMTLKQILTEASAAILAAGNDPASAALADSLSSTTIQYASVVIATLPVIMVYPFLQKYFAKGAMVGGVKG